MPWLSLEPTLPLVGLKMLQDPNWFSRGRFRRKCSDLRLVKDLDWLLLGSLCYGFRFLSTFLGLLLRLGQLGADEWRNNCKSKNKMVSTEFDYLVEVVVKKNDE